MIYVLLPVYNEESNVAFLIPQIAEVFRKNGRDYRIIAVNDGSTDRSSAELESAKQKFPLEVITFDVNRGVGAVFRAGLSRAAELSAGKEDILISLDCDRTHPPECFSALIAALDKGAGVAIASRYHPQSRDSGLPLFRAFLSNAVNLLLRFFLRVKGVKDYTTFFRAYRMALLKEAFRRFDKNFIRQPGFACMAEIMARLKELRPQICEVPVFLHFDMREGRSKMKIGRTIREYLSLLAGELYHRRLRLFSNKR